MFYYLNGTLEINEAGCCVVDCSGVGYKLTTSLITSELLRDKLGQKVKIFTHLAVREDGIELFGFESNEERECFNKLITVSGVGPKAAMNILSIMTPDSFALSVCTEDIKAISKASGIGSKTAARIVLELKDKLSTMSDEEQLKLLATDGMLVKRPLVIGEDFVLVGFKESEWSEKL
jgi:Holliday junction DNA helicase RuvA